MTFSEESRPVGAALFSSSTSYRFPSLAQTGGCSCAGSGASLGGGMVVPSLR